MTNPAQSIFTPKARKEGLAILPDDYYEVWNKFSEIIQNRNWLALPAGIEAHASPPDYVVPNISITNSKSLHCYNMDARGRLDPHKSKVLMFYQQLLGEELELDMFTLFPSSTQAILAVLMSCAEKADRKIVLARMFHKPLGDHKYRTTRLGY